MSATPTPAAATPAAATPAAATTQGDRAGFEALVREHGPALEAFALRLAGNAADGRDLYQDAIERALRRYASFAAGTNARAWLFTIVHNLFIDRCRQRRREPRREAVESANLPAPEAAEVPAWTTISDEDLRGAIAGLEEEFRVVYRMHTVDGLSYKDIAERLQVPINTVGSRMARARHKLRALLEAARGGEP